MDPAAGPVMSQPPSLDDEPTVMSQPPSLDTAELLRLAAPPGSQPPPAAAAIVAGPPPPEAGAAAAAAAPAPAVPPAALQIMGAAPTTKKRGYLFSSENQPAKSKRQRGSLDYITDPTARRKTLNRYIKSLEKSIKALEASTGASFVCLAQHPAGAVDGTSLRVLGAIDTPLMRAVYSDPDVTRLRSTILREQAGQAGPPPLSAPVMRAQLQIVLGTQLTRGSNAPIPSWWPDDVRFTKTYGIPKMKEADVGKLYDAFGGFLVGSGQYGQQPTPQGELLDDRPAVVPEDVKRQMAARWRATHPNGRPPQPAAATVTATRAAGPLGVPTPVPPLPTRALPIENRPPQPPPPPGNEEVEGWT